MKNVKLNNKGLKSVIFALILLAVGILFCFSKSIGDEGLSTIFGSVLIVIGVIFIITSIVDNRKLITVEGIGGGAIIAFGILIIASKLTATLIKGYLPYLLICISSVTLLDAIIAMALKVRKNQLRLVLEVFVGIALLALGICLMVIKNFDQHTYLILGIVLIMYSMFILISTIMKKSNRDK